MNNVNVATAFHRIAKLGRVGRSNEFQVRGDERTRLLAAAVLERMDGFSAKSIASLAWSHAEFRHGGPQFMELLLRRFVTVLEQEPETFGARELGSVFTSCGKLVVGREAIESVAPIISSKIESVSERGILHIVWGMAQIELYNDDILEKCEKALENRTKLLNNQGRGNLVWALAKLDRFNEPLFEQLMADCIPSIHQANAIDISNYAWGFGRFFEHMSERFLEEKGVLMEEVFSDSQKLYYGMLCQKGYDQFVNALCNQTLVLLKSRSRVDVLVWTVMWFLGVVRWKSPELLDLLCSSSVKLSHLMTPRSVATSLWCLAKQRLKHEELLDCLASRGLELFFGQERTKWEREINSQTVSMCMYSLAFLNYLDSASSRSFFIKLEDMAVDILHSCSGQGIVNIAWAEVASGNLQEHLLKEVTREVTRRTEHKSMEVFSDVELSMLHQFHLLLRLEAPYLVMDLSSNHPANALFKMLYDVGRTHYSAEKKWEKAVIVAIPKITSFHKEVLEVVTALGYECIVEYIDGYAIDIALVDEKVAVEVDGPTHFAENTLEPLGSTLLKRRILEGLGWKLLSIPFFEWGRYPLEEEKMAYIERKLTLLGVDKPSQKQAKGVQGVGDPEISQNQKCFKEDYLKIAEDDCKTIVEENAQRKRLQEDGILEKRASLMEMRQYKRGHTSKHSLLVKKAVRKTKSRDD